MLKRCANAFFDAWWLITKARTEIAYLNNHITYLKDQISRLQAQPEGVLALNFQMTETGQLKRSGWIIDKN